MKENKHIVAYAALGTYGFVMSMALFMNSWATQTKKHNDDLQERIDRMGITNTAEDMIEFMYSDVDNGYIDSMRAESYFINLQEIVDRNCR